MYNNIYRTNNEDRNCLSCKYCKIDMLFYDCMCVKSGSIIDYSLADDDYTVCDDYASSEN